MVNLKPEMHDIGKLIDNSIIKHNFEDYPGKVKDVPSIEMNPVWKGILQHHCSKDDYPKGFSEYPRSFSTFVLSLADSVAAATSRHLEIKGEKSRYNIFKFWNQPKTRYYKLTDMLKIDVDALKWVSKIVNFVNQDPSVDEFFEVFGEYLKNRVEDATPGSDITSLWTHCKLTALLYNFLYSYLEKIDDKWFKVATKDDIRNYIHKIRENTKVKVARIKINFPQSPVRIRDLNVFDTLTEIKNEILNKYQNNVIFIGFNELLLILPLDDDFKRLKEIVFKYGFWFEIVERIQNLNQPYPDPDRLMRQIKKLQKIQQRKFEEELKKQLSRIPSKIPSDKRKEIEKRIRENVRKTFEKGKEAKRITELKGDYHFELKKRIYKKGSIYTDLPPNIDPPICELCQMNHGTEKWVDEESGITEELCINCFNIRKRGAKFPKLDEWEKEGVSRILWIKIDLDMDELISVLEDLYAEYLKTLGVSDPEERAEIRFSVLTEFDWDYKEFLNKFKKRLLETFGEDNFQQILDEFISIRIESLREIQTVLEIFDEMFGKIFPKFKEITSPIRLGIVCSNIKYPFLECWRVLSNLENEINVSLIGKGEIKLNMSQLTSFLMIDVRNKALLHKLTALSNTSNKLAEVTLYDRADRDYRRYKPLRDAVSSFGFQNLLTYAKIMGD